MLHEPKEDNTHTHRHTHLCTALCELKIHILVSIHTAPSSACRLLGGSKRQTLLYLYLVFSSQQANKRLTVSA